MTEAYDGRRVLVAGLGLSGRSVARALLERGARVMVVDDRTEDRLQQQAAELRAGGAEVRLGEPTPDLDVELVVTSPGWRPDQPVLAAASDAGIEVIGEPELAWRLRPPGAPDWLGVTGTNGKTTTVGLLASILTAAGLRTVAAGNVGVPLIDVVQAQPGYDVLAVELSSFQLHWSSTLRCAAASVLNVADDHTDWHGSFAAYAEDKAKILRGDAVAIVNLDDAGSIAASVASSRRIGFTVGEPGRGEFGVRDGALVEGDGVPLADLAGLPLPGSHNVSNALAASALASQQGASPAAIRAGLAAYAPGRHRNEVVATGGGVVWVNDSKATNPHAAAASLAAYDSVVWIAGGLLKGAAVDDLVATVAARLRAVVLIGRDQAHIAAALARHATDVPVVTIDTHDTNGMDEAVAAAARLAQPGDTVLLAPAAASMDMFRDYAERGDRFVAAAERATAARDR
ncbi:MAG TPA: UDP-N-acetylmuramoyl-L-alanine--D-glutamate ligase [Mycobacteriales bacterium]|nr:UDP-N-acetylmuramoyl-L-alanine--D-glutamate ligase [Mycobacteriales bacterium]